MSTAGHCAQAHLPCPALPCPALALVLRVVIAWRLSALQRVGRHRAMGAQGMGVGERGIHKAASTAHLHPQWRPPGSPLVQVTGRHPRKTDPSPFHRRNPSSSRWPSVGNQHWACDSRASARSTCAVSVPTYGTAAIHYCTDKLLSFFAAVHGALIITGDGGGILTVVCYGHGVRAR